MFEVRAAEDTDIVGYEVVPEGEEGGGHGHTEKGTVHNNFNQKSEGNCDEDSHEYAFEDLFDHA